MTFQIYVLKDEHGQIRYVGKTCRSLRERFWGHLGDARDGKKTHLYNWIRSVLARGFIPEIMEIGSGEGDGSEDERAWIGYFRAEGVELVNATDGGEGRPGMKLSEETKRRIGNGNRGKKRSPELRQRISAQLRLRVHSPETCAKRNAKLRGKKRSAETIARMTAARRARLGNPISAETREKMRQARLGKKLAPEVLAKLREANQGRKHSAEVRARMRAGTIAAWQRRKGRVI